MMRPVAAATLTVTVTLALSGAALADEYADALRCLVLIEFAKVDYETGNIDTLRDAGNFYIAETDRTRPAGLSDQQKLDLFTGMIDDIRNEGGLASEANKATAKACTERVKLTLTLP